ncbi:MAG: chitin deacetylase, partial [Alphaproteobacteria bacterium]|nr:chitin deacetylase [Alphaproteobacteria bacterium]
MQTPYPRDMVGYGGRPPHPRWPGNAKIAVQFVFNYEEGSENTILEGDGKVEVLLAETPGGRMAPGKRDLGIESAYEYGSRAGFWRLHRLFQERQVPATVYACALALERNPPATEAIARGNYEIAGHGWRWLEHYNMEEAEEREHIRRCVESLTRQCGRRPVGWYSRYAPSLNPRRLLVEEGGFI